MKLVYDKSYWDQYYGASYEETFRYGFNFKKVLDQCWTPVFGNTPPQSFADIGCGPGQTLNEAEKLLGSKARVYGVEVQDIPPERVVSDKILFGDFLEIHDKLDPVDLLYVACSMYVPWDEQEVFLKACLTLTKKACWFANVYLTDRDGIPEDPHRVVIYKSRPQFAECLGSMGWKKYGVEHDFFYKKV